MDRHSVGAKVLLLLIGGVVVTAAVSLFTMRSSIRKQGVESLRESMRATLIEAESVRESISRLGRDRAFDSAGLLKRMNQSSLRESTMYQTIPVVAAWTAIEIVAKEQGYAFRIPKNQARNPKNEPRPEEAEILRRLEGGQAAEYFEVNDERNEVIYARPIRLTEDCLACHGDPATSPTRDGRDIAGFRMENWRAGEVHGAFVLRTKLDRVDQVASAGLWSILMWLGPVAVLLTGGALWITRRQIILPMAEAMHVLEDVGTGNLNVQAPALGEGEIGRIGKTVNEMVAGLRQTLTVVRSNESHLSGSSAELSTLSSTLSGAAAETVAQADRVATASQEVSSSVGSAAAVSEEMFASIREISRSTTDAARVANEASAMAQQTRQSVARLDESSVEIGKVVEVIRGIAEKTHLLALNATIEAAHAGDAGKGFAVVAAEVKLLAEQTSNATGEIRQRIQTIQHDTTGAVSEIQSITAIVEQISQLNGVIAAAVEEQNSATEEIGRALGQAVACSRDIDSSIQGVADAARSTTATAERTQEAARLLDSVSARLREAMSRFQLA